MADDYKFSVVKQDRVDNIEGFPKHFLGDTLDEAEEVYKENKRLLDSFAYSYSVTTGLDKHDLFGHALIGLAKAKRDWDPKRSENFKTFAIFNIKDELNEALRQNCASVVIPSYIKKAASNVNAVASICAKYGVGPGKVVYCREIPKGFNDWDTLRCKKLFDVLEAAAKRAKVDYEKFIERVFCVPEEVSYEDQIGPEKTERDQQLLEAAMLVEQLKSHMDDDELTICTGIMADRTYEEIGEELGKSPAWVFKKLQSFRNRVLKLN